MQVVPKRNIWNFNQMLTFSYKNCPISRFAVLLVFGASFRAFYKGERTYWQQANSPHCQLVTVKSLHIWSTRLFKRRHATLTEEVDSTMRDRSEFGDNAPNSLKINRWKPSRKLLRHFCEETLAKFLKISISNWGEFAEMCGDLVVWRVGQKPNKHYIGNSRETLFPNLLFK